MNSGRCRRASSSPRGRVQRHITTCIAADVRTSTRFCRRWATFACWATVGAGLGRIIASQKEAHGRNGVAGTRIQTPFYSMVRRHVAKVNPDDTPHVSPGIGTGLLVGRTESPSSSSDSLLESVLLQELARLIVHFPSALLLAVFEATFVPELAIGMVSLPGTVLLLFIVEAARRP